jgi:hypothetical protein
VLEIGPGYGAATRWLLEHGGHLTAVEGDPKMVANLSNEFGEQCRRPQRRALIPLPRQPPGGTALTDSPYPLAVPLPGTTFHRGVASSVMSAAGPLLFQ